MKNKITQPLASMLDHQIHSPLQSISLCIVLQRAGGPQADPAAWPPDSSAKKKQAEHMWIYDYEEASAWFWMCGSGVCLTILYSLQTVKRCSLR